jgi:arsenate reductase (thioredoxin)
MGVTTVLFACVHNAGRSQMAAAWFQALADPTRATGLSAGTRPGDRVHPEVVAVMRERGVDLSGGAPQRLTPELAARAQVLITMGCGDECPIVPGAERRDWPLDDPKGRPLEEVRVIRDEIERRVRALIAERAWGQPAGGPEAGSTSQRTPR